MTNVHMVNVLDRFFFYVLHLSGKAFVILRTRVMADAIPIATSSFISILRMSVTMTNN